MQKLGFFIIPLLFVSGILCAQLPANVVKSNQQEIGRYNHFNVIGACSHGVLVHQYGKAGHVIELYNNKMSRIWVKNIPVPEKDIEVLDMDEYNDTLRMVYMFTSNNKQFLKYQYFNDSLNPLFKQSIPLDSFANNFTENNSISISYSLNRALCLIYIETADLQKTYKIPYFILNSQGILLRKTASDISSAFKSPSVSDAYVFSKSGRVQTCFVYGEYESKSSKNDFPFPKYGITFSGDSTIHYEFEEKDLLLSSGDYKWDYVFNKLIICGLYSNNPGNNALGFFYVSLSPGQGIITKKISPLTHETDLQFNGDPSRKKVPEINNYKVRAIAVKSDGGCLLQCEQIYQTTETFRNTNISFSVTSPTTLNFYHYDDILTASFTAAGDLVWTKVLHKKQESEGDGGYYLSYCESIGEKNISYFYNDGSYNSATLTNYNLSPEGKLERKELFSNEKNGLMLIPQFGKQVSYNEIVIPSIRKNKLLFIKFTL